MNTQNIYKSIFIVLLLCMFSLPETAHGQIWKKIKKKTQEKVERTVSDKASDKAADMAADNMDKMLNAKVNPFGKGEKKADASNLADSYSFEWKYQMEIKLENPKSKDDLTMDYYLSPGADYFGFSMPQMPSMFTVIDTRNEAMVSFMEQGDQPLALAYELPDDIKNSDAEASPNDYTITELPDKTFLGYESKGMQLENTDQRVIMYMAKNAPVGFTGAVNSNKSNVPADVKSYVQKNGHGLMMYMRIIDKNDADKNMEMKGISLDETIMVKKSSNYKFM